MEMAVSSSGDTPIYTQGTEIGMDERESVEDVVRILQGYHAVIAARVFDHDVLRRMVDVAAVPIVNMLSDRAHPLQALADALTMEDALGSLDGRTVAWVGDYNNVARSLGEICVRLGAAIRYACPVGYAAEDAELERLTLLGSASVTQSHRPTDAVAGADAVHSDTWVSMGQEDDKAARKQAFEGFTVDAALMGAGRAARRVHALPAGVPRSRGHRRRHRRAAQPRVPAGPRPPPRRQGRPGLPAG